MIETPDSVPVKEMLVVAAPFIKSVVDTYITPKLESLKERFSLDYNKYHIPTEEHFTEYFYRTYKRISIVNTLVFNNTQCFLKDIYIPLTLKKADHSEKKFKIEHYPDELISTYERLLITDTAGMGKSTLMKKIFIETVDKSKSIPVLIELRRLTKSNTIIDEIHQQINSIDKNFDESLLLELIKIGGFTFILDGYDEISLSERESVTSDVQKFIHKVPNNNFILTSRPENALASFGDFHQFTIEPLKKTEAFELLRKYDRQGIVSAHLIKKLQETEMSNISEFLTNPLLVSLLFTAFQYKQAIPFKKYLFYRQVFDANFESHDLTKGDSYNHDKYTKLEIDDFHRVLRHIGYSCLKKDQRIEFSKDEILNMIRESKEFCVGLKFSESDFLKDLLVNVPLFSQDGNFYRWAHKSLQEYFAAQFIYLDSKTAQARILKQIYHNTNQDKFQNVLDLYYDIDPKTFRNVIIYEVLKEYRDYYNDPSSVFPTSIDAEAIKLRKEICFLLRPCLFYVKYEPVPTGSSKGSVKRIRSDIDHDKLNKMFVDFSREKKENVTQRISGRIMAIESSKELYCIYIEDVKFTILRILSRKKDSLIEEIPITQKRNSHINIKYPELPEYKMIEVTPGKNKFFNSKANFEEVNNFIKASRLSSVKIISSVAFTLLEEIERNIRDEESSDFLTTGL